MSNNSIACTGLVNNPDISGVGVRVSFYLQTFLLVLLVDRSWQDAPSALWTFIATSFGLTIAAIVQRKQLSFFQALQVSNLVWLANFGTFVALASYSRQKAESHKNRIKTRPDYHVKFGAMIQTLLSMTLTLYMWVTAATFGNQAPCAPLINYMLFVIKAPALGSGRTVGLTVSGILTAVYIAITLHELRSCIRSRHKKKEKVEQDQFLPTHVTRSSSSLTSSNSNPAPIPSAFIPTSLPIQGHPARDASISLSTSTPTQKSERNPRSSQKRRPKRRRWSADLDPMLVGIIICQAMVFTYFIVSSELLISYNPSTDNGAWQMGFGQILALIVVIPSALSVVGALKEHGLKRLSKRKKKTLNSSHHGKRRQT